LGLRANELTGVTICGSTCTFEWQSKNKVIARIGNDIIEGKGDVIVTTSGGGEGTSTVQFRTYKENVGPLKESAVWIEETPLQSIAWGRRTISQTGYSLQEDPLGLSIEGNENKFPGDLRELFPENSGDLSRENFSPCWFLLENHYATTFDDLRAGYSFLKRKVEGQKEGQLSFLKTHAGAVIDQIDTLMNLKNKMNNDGDVDLAKRIQNLQGTIEKSINSSHALFDDVLSRRAAADRSRAALSVLNRYKFLFCLPKNIELNAKKNEFDIIANDYARAKNLYGKSEIPMIQKVLSEVDEIILEIRRELHKKLQEMPQGVEQQKRLVKSLLNLEVQQIGTIQSEKLKIVDPAWDAIESRARYIEEIFKKTYEQFQEKESKEGSIKRDSNSPPIRVLFCEEITEIATGQFPDLWRLGQSYFTGELRGINEPKPGNFKQIILRAIERFCIFVRAAILPSNQKFQQIPHWQFNSSSQVALFNTWLPTCLRYLRVSYASLIRLDLPSEALDIVLKLIDELRLYCLTTILKKAIEKVKNLHEKETWELTVSEFPGSTSLPSKLEELLTEVLEEGQQICLLMEIRENSLFDTPNSEAHREVSKIVETILQCFSQVIEELATERSDDEVQHLPRQLIGFPNNSAILPHSINLEEAKSTISSTITITWEHRLLCCLANSAYCNKIFINSLGNLFTKFGYPVPKLALESSRSIINNVFSNLLEIYVEHKSDPLVSTIEPSMYIVSHFQWDLIEKFDKLSPYAHECLDNVISVYSEIFAVSPLLLRPILEQIIQTIGEELARLMASVEEFNEIGKLQANLDIRVIRDALRLYSNERAKVSFNEAIESIPKLTNEENKRVEVMISSVKQRMKLQLLCLSTVNP
jgi:exocyst complex component 2